MEIDRIKKLFEESKIHKEGSWELYSEAMKYALPNESDVGTETSLKKAEGIYDSTVMIENNKLARKQVNMILPTNLQWGGLKTDLKPDANSQETETLQMYGDNVYKVLVNSNLNKEALGFFLNLGIGTACMKIVYTGNMKRPIEVMNIPLPNFYFLEGANGRITHTFVETNNLRYDQLLAMFPDTAGGLSEEQTYNIVECAVPSENAGKYEYIVALSGFSEELYRTELGYNPFMVCRTLKTGNSIWGNGVVINVLPNVVNLNDAVYKRRVAGQASIKPALAFEGDPKMMQRMNIELGKMIYLGARGQNAINPLNLVGNINVELMNIESDLAQIREGMFSSYISNIGQGVQPKTATEWQFRNSEFLEVFSANYAMIEEEFLIPLFMNTLYILAELKYNDMDLSILEDDEVAPVFYNKLTENYKQEKIQNLNACLQNLVSILGTPQAVLGVINLPETAKKLSDWYDMDKSLLKDDAEIEQFMEAYLQQIMQGGGQNA